MDDAKVAEVAAGLGANHRDTIIRMSRNFSRYPVNGPAELRRHAPFLVEFWNKPFGGFRYRLTPLGLAVRAHLQENNHG